jgi:hypothetical protein
MYFARADKFKDKYEGAIPKQNYLHFVDLYKNKKENGEDINREIKNEFLEKVNERKKKAAISCWHFNESESAAMWEVYSRAGQGIAVCTTAEKLQKLEKPDGYEMEMFRVDYIDFDKTYNEDFINYELLPFKIKRKEFEYEQEFRIMLYQKKTEKPVVSKEVTRDFISELEYMPEEGIKISINTSELIDEIIASPDMKEYETAEIQKILNLINKEKGTNFKIERSRLYENLRY